MEASQFGGKEVGWWGLLVVIDELVFFKEKKSKGHILGMRLDNFLCFGMLNRRLVGS